MPESVPTMSFDRRKPSHVHRRLLRDLTDEKFFPLTCTFQTQDNERTPAGGMVTDGAWTDVDGLVDIPCRRGVPESAERQANERPRDWGKVEIEPFVVVLNGYFATVTSFMRVVISDGQIIDISGVNTDSELQVTTVTGKVVTPGAQPVHT